MDKVNTRIPIMFQKLNTYQVEDTRFMNVKIFLMHLGENFNGSYFSKEVVEEAIPSLANTPILAYIEENSSGDDDFSDHRSVLVKEDGQYKIKYIGQAIGVIPESNNAQFEKRVSDDGIEREYLTINGLIWTKWDDAVDILNRDKIKSESMELHDDYEGEFQEDNLFHFTKFKFFGACGLGVDLQPAMINATIEVKDFSMQDFSKDIQQKMEQFKNFMASQSSKGVDIDKNEKGGIDSMDEKLELLKKYNLEKDKLDFSIDDLSLEDLEIKLKEMSKPDSSFSLSNNQLEDEIRKVLRGMTTITHDYWGDAYEQQLWYFRDIKDGIVIVIDSDWSNYYGVPYTVSGDNVTLDFDNKVPYVADWRPKQEGDTASNFVKEEVEAIVKHTAEKAKEKFEIEKNDAVKVVQDKLDEASKDFTTLKTENEELKEFKNTRLSEIRQEQENELFTKFSKLDGDEDYETIKTNAKNYSIEDLEKEIAVVYARKTVTFSSKSKEKSTIKVPVDFSKDEKKGENPYGDVFIKYKK